MGDSLARKEEIRLAVEGNVVVKLRKEFVEACLVGEVSFSALCRTHGISRKTGYKWLQRSMEGLTLEDQSRRPKTSPKAVADWMERGIVAFRKLRPTWGPRKLRASLQRSNPGMVSPSVSTLALILKRNGLIVPRRRRRTTPPSSVPLAHATAPNKVWCIDFKGHFPVGKQWCYPLTITDAFSRYILACIALPKTDRERVGRAMALIFETFGLPESIRSDNGAPFASRAPGGLSELSLWWLRLGIRHERIAPGKPQQNGRHERMRRTLKQEAASPPVTTMKEQQQLRDNFRAEYNESRPHEALGNALPADLYERSQRRFSAEHWGAPFEYPEDYGIVHVRHTGSIMWNDESVMLSPTLAEQRLGLDWRDGNWDVYVGPLRIGMLKTRRGGKTIFARSEDRHPSL